MGSKAPNPPLFARSMTYQAWRKKLELWTLVTKYPEKERAIVVLLEALKDNPKAERAVADLSIEELNADNGVTTLLTKLDGVFKAETADEAFDAYSSFNNFIRPPDTSMTDYIVEFEHRYAKLLEHKMELPDTILAFKVLEGAKLDENQRQLALTLGSDLKFSSMKSGLKRIFSGCSDNSDPGSATGTIIKQETAYIARGNKFKNRKQFSDKQAASSKLSKLNPLNKLGRVSRCLICDSKMHWASDCPHGSSNANLTSCSDVTHVSSEEDDIYLIYLNSECANDVFSEEPWRYGIVDTACSKTVSGKQWYDAYLENLPAIQREVVRESSSCKIFRFGDGLKTCSSITSIIPIQVGQKICFLEVEIIDGSLPLLLSKKTLKKLGSVLDLKNDTALMLEEELKLQITSNGHYCINIFPNENYVPYQEVLINTKDDLNLKGVTKVHRQFGHASVGNLQKLFKNAEMASPEVDALVKRAVDCCEVCKVYKRPAPKPVVSISRSTEFNQCIALDLHQVDKGVWFLHMIDEFTRYSSAAIIYNKMPSTIIRKFMQHWISVLGPPQQIITDNGGEFACEEFKDMCENFNIKYITTPAYSPWCNGVCERHIKTLSETFSKVQEDMSKRGKVDVETALAWSLHAKNSLVNYNGFSPNQLVFGSNAELPTVLKDKLPALEGSSASAAVAMNIFALHMARREFLRSESSEKIRRSLRSQTRQGGISFSLGQNVYYKRDGHPKWKGPGKVIGQDGPVVFVRHGGQYVKVHSCRLQPASVEQDPEGFNLHAEKDYSESDKSEDLSDETETDLGGSDENVPISDLSTDASASSQPDEKSELATSDVSSKVVHFKEAIASGQTGDSLKTGERITFSLDGVEYQGKIIGRAGKQSGRYKQAYNIEYFAPEEKKGERGYVDFDKVDNITRTDSSVTSTETSEEINMVEGVDFSEAKRAELQSWKDNGVYQEVDDVGQQTISTRWICTLKNSGTGVTPKARLVARGFEERIQDFPKESPTCSKDSLRVLLAITAQKGWDLNTIDIKTAFLQGKTIQRDVFLKPPKEVGFAKVWKLQKCVYGLSDASLMWYERMAEFMTSAGAKMSSTDPAVFYYYHINVLQGVIALHVDDILWSGTPYFSETFIPKLRDTFKVGCEKSESFQYLGLSMNQDGSKIDLNQDSYIASLKLLTVPRRDKESQLSNNEVEVLRSCVGQLLWASNQTRPDCCFEACQLATSLKAAKVKHIRLANKVIRKLKTHSVGLKFENLANGAESLKLLVYSDAAFANLEDGASQGGHLIFLTGSAGTYSLLSWQSKKLKRVAKSTLMAETLALSEAMDCAALVNHLFSEIYFAGLKTLPVEVVEVVIDNKSLLDALQSKRNVSDKRLRIEISALREMVDKKEICQVRWVESQKQLANVLTKHGASSETLRHLLCYGHLI